MSVRAYIEPEKIPPAVKELLETLRRGGFAAYPVGGAVRDSLLGRPFQDVDLAAKASPGQIAALFSGARFLGRLCGLPGGGRCARPAAGKAAP